MTKGPVVLILAIVVSLLVVPALIWKFGPRPECREGFVAVPQLVIGWYCVAGYMPRQR